MLLIASIGFNLVIERTGTTADINTIIKGKAKI
jgi:hypothetical protein